MPASHGQIFSRRTVAVALLASALAGCDSGVPVTNQAQVIVTASPTPAATAQGRTKLPEGASKLVEGDTVVERVDPADIPVDPPRGDPGTGPIQTRKDFKDPPLPAELKDDGGLKPLPPRPAASPAPHP